MDIKPIKHYRWPHYPTREDVMKDPLLLSESLPLAWKLSPRLAGAAAFLLTLSTCLPVGAETGTPTVKPPTETATRPIHTPTITLTPAPTEFDTFPVTPGTALVAPIFKHGEGRGAIGCVVVASPYYLSEEEALQIIREEMQAGGITFTRENVAFPDIVTPQLKQEHYEENGSLKTRTVEIPGAGQVLSIDLVDDQNRIGVEFISLADHFEWAGGFSTSSVTFIDFPSAVEHLNQEVQEQGGNLIFATFYDPSTSVERDASTPYDQVVNEEARQLLREQVKDFIDWLAAQGVQ